MTRSQHFLLHRRLLRCCYTNGMAHSQHHEAITSKTANNDGDETRRAGWISSSSWNREENKNDDFCVYFLLLLRFNMVGKYGGWLVQSRASQSHPYLIYFSYYYAICKIMVNTSQVPSLIVCLAVFDNKITRVNKQIYSFFAVHSGVFLWLFVLIGCFVWAWIYMFCVGMVCSYWG